MTPTRIYRIAATALGVPERPVLRDLNVGAVRDPVIRARHAAWWLARDAMGMTWGQIADLFGESRQRVRYGANRTVDRRMDCLAFQAQTDAARDFMRADLRREGRAA